MVICIYRFVASVILIGFAIVFNTTFIAQLVHAIVQTRIHHTKARDVTNTNRIGWVHIVVGWIKTQIHQHAVPLRLTMRRNAAQYTIGCIKHGNIFIVIIIFSATLGNF